MNVWTCLLLSNLLYAQFAAGLSNTVIREHCPTNCSCTTGGHDSSSLTVDCHARKDIDHKQLAGHLSTMNDDSYDELDLLLSSNRTYGHLTSLRIIKSPLTHVPHSICRLTTLTELHLDYNRLTRLPDNCLSNLSNLAQFSAHDNAIETLQDGVFDGLTKLEYLDLSRNRMRSIGLSVFATSSDLSSLFTIKLSENDLTSLEPWFYDRGIISGSYYFKKVSINLTHNRISQFTNKMGFHSNLCYGKTPYVHVYLQNNHIKYLADIYNGWKLRRSCYKVDQLGMLNFRLWIDDNDIACDCVNYEYFYGYRNGYSGSTLSKVLHFTRQKIGHFGDPSRYISYFPQPIDDLEVRCKVTDPLTGRSKISNGFVEDLSLFVCELTERCPTGCVCAHRPHNATLHIYCSDRNLTVLPLELPQLPDSHTKYKLDFSNNRLLRRLEYRDYFANTSILDVSNSGVDNIKDWEEIIKMPDINLFGNQISALPPTFLSVNVTAGKLDLANNPLDCSCDNKWMSKWFNLTADRLTQKVLCYSPSRLQGKDIVQVSDDCLLYTSPSPRDS